MFPMNDVRNQKQSSVRKYLLSICWVISVVEAGGCKWRLLVHFLDAQTPVSTQKLY